MFSLGRFFSGLAEKFGEDVSTSIDVMKRGELFEVWVSVRVVNSRDMSLESSRSPVWDAVGDLASSTGFLDAGDGFAFERRYFARSKDVRGCES